MGTRMSVCYTMLPIFRVPQRSWILHKRGPCLLATPRYAFVSCPSGNISTHHTTTNNLAHVSRVKTPPTLDPIPSPDNPPHQTMRLIGAPCKVEPSNPKSATGLNVSDSPKMGPNSAPIRCFFVGCWGSAHRGYAGSIQSNLRFQKTLYMCMCIYIYMYARI